MIQIEVQDVEDDTNEQQSAQRKFIGIWFECCHTYGRLYKNKEGNLYTGRCPKCLRMAQIRVDSTSEKATNRRFFRGS